MNVNGLNNNLIDAASAQKVTESLFNALQKKSVDYSKKDLSRFTRQSLGVDLYNTKTDINTQRQIAITKSGAAFNQMELNAVKALNSFAAAQLYAGNIQENVGGKMTIEQVQQQIEFISKPSEASSAINVFEADKDKKSFNPFYFGESSADAKNK